MVRQLYLYNFLTADLGISQSSILRQIVAGPRQQHAEAGLDLCYVTDNGSILIIFTPNHAPPLT